MGIIYLLKCNTVYIVSNRFRRDIPFEILKILYEMCLFIEREYTLHGHWAVNL